MRHSAKLTVALCIGLGWSIVGTLSQAQDTDASSPGAEAAPSIAGAPLTPALDVTLGSRYLFQGIDYSDGRSVLQPNFAVSHKQFSAALWVNYQPDLGDVNEVDLTLKYTHEIGRLSASPGYMMLKYPNRDWDPSQELFVDLAMTAPLSPTLSVHYDFGAGDGAYLTLGLSQALPMPLTLATNVFYQSNYYEMTGIPAVELKASASFDHRMLTLTPSLSRILTSENQDFRGPARIESGWLFTVNLAPKL